jgi:DNA-binding IclR family transcriptional regulator
MARVTLEDEVLRALRARPDQTLGELADTVGLPRTNFGRRLARRVQSAVEHLVNERLVEEYDGRYRLSERGRRTLAERALDSGLSL